LKLGNLRGCLKSKKAHVTVWVDGGYRSQSFQHWVIDVYRWILSVVTCHEQRKGFAVLPKRWLVERLLVGLIGVGD